jgi:GPH family glycoside/pentoside/hexuronide:cation symporter
VSVGLLWKDGKQIDGVLGATISFAQKIGTAVGAIITGTMLGMAGYDGSLAVQSDGANAMIKFLYLGFPALMCLLSAFPMSRYDLEKKIPQIEQEIAERNRENADAEE